MRSNTWRAIMLLSLTLVLVSTAMDAQAARRSSLAGNQFINDADDMFAFPQLTHKYKNRIILDLGQDSDESSGSIVFGDKSVWNFNTGRGMYANTTSWAWGGTDRMPAGFSNPDYEWWDLGFATHFGDTPFGVRVNWQKDTNKTTRTSADPTVQQDNSENMFGIQLGTTLGSVELAGEFGFGSYKDEVPGLDPSNVNDSSMTLITLLARGDLYDVGGLDWRWLAAFSTGSASYDAEGVADDSGTAFRASFGPVWGEPGVWEVAAYMSFDYMKYEEPNFNDADLKDTDTITNFPSYNMAMEYYLNSWFVLRGGVKSDAGSFKEEQQFATDDTREETDRDYNIDWTLGLGVDKGNWGLDFALNEDNVHTGYLPFNGDQQSLDHPLALISAWLAWGAE